MTDALHAIAVAAGLVLVVVIVSDAISTLVVTQGTSRAWRPARLWYSATWRLIRRTVALLPSRAAEFVLSVYPAVSLLGLLVLWLAGLTVAWSLVYLGIGERVNGAGDWGTLLYYSGTSLLTPAFGTAHSGVARGLSLLEALTGLGTIALLISYLPALYGAYSKREARLLTLDDPLGGRITPVRVVAVHAADGDVDLLYRFCAEWEMWTAEVLESHVSYPMLALFRSQHPGQSWITAMGVVTDAATLATACVVGADQREPYMLHRRGRRAIVDIAERLHLPAPSGAPRWLTRESLEIAYEALERTGLPLHDREQSWQRLRELHEPYGARLQQLIDFLLAPHGFWGHSAEETVYEEIARARDEARARVRSRQS